MRKQLVLAMALLLFLPALSFGDFTGKWKCDDGSTYYLRQIGNNLYWYGENSATNPSWSNVFKGNIEGDHIFGQWADVPKGKHRNHGEMELAVIEGGNKLKAIHKTGGFGGSIWTRTVKLTVKPKLPVGKLVKPLPTVKEDCVGFNPDTTKVQYINGRWKVVDGSHWMFDFGNNEAEARKALSVIKRYRINQSCFVGRPDPSFKYLLVSGTAPSGSMNGEDCISFNPDTAIVKNINGRWKIVDGSHWMFDFGNKESEARDALAIIKKYRFTRSCFVGRPDPSFEYLRK